jgi:hypothetical protein
MGKTFDSNKECVKVVLHLRFDEDKAFDFRSWIIELFFGFNINYEGLIAMGGITHYYNWVWLIRLLIDFI